MRPARYYGGGGGFGAGGGPMATRLTIAIGALSVLVAIGGRMVGGGLLQHLLFTPSMVLRGEVWQILTYAFFIPLGLGGSGIFGFLISLYFLYSIGGQVEAVLGGRRFLRFFVSVAALSAILTIPFSLLFGFQHLGHSGIWVSLGALTILFAHNFAHQPIYLFFVLPVQGRQLIVFSFGILALYAVLSSLWQVFPQLLGLLLALAYTRGLLQPRRAWLRFRAWRIERELKRRSSRFSVIRGGRDRKDPWLH